VDTGARRAFLRAAGHGGAGGCEGAELSPGDRGVDEDDVLGVHQPGGAGAGDGKTQVRDIARRGTADDDGEHPAGPQRTVACCVRCRLVGVHATCRQVTAGQGDRNSGLPGTAGSAWQLAWASPAAAGR